jgi:hypothetical protein
MLSGCLSLAQSVPPWLAILCDFLMSFSFSTLKILTSLSHISYLPIWSPIFVLGQEPVCWAAHGGHPLSPTSNRQTHQIQFQSCCQCHTMLCRVQNYVWLLTIVLLRKKPSSYTVAGQWVMYMLLPHAMRYLINLCSVIFLASTPCYCS